MSRAGSANRPNSGRLTLGRSWVLELTITTDDISQADSDPPLARCQAPALEVPLMSLTPITATQFHEAWGTSDWRIVGDGAVTSFATGTYLAGARLVAAISELPGIDAAEPDIDIRRDAVTVRLVTITDDYYGMTEQD